MAGFRRGPDQEPRRGEVWNQREGACERRQLSKRDQEESAKRYDCPGQAERVFEADRPQQHVRQLRRSC